MKKPEFSLIDLNLTESLGVGSSKMRIELFQGLGSRNNLQFVKSLLFHFWTSLNGMKFGVHWKGWMVKDSCKLNYSSSTFGGSNLKFWESMDSYLGILKTELIWEVIFAVDGHVNPWALDYWFTLVGVINSGTDFETHFSWWKIFGNGV